MLGYRARQKHPPAAHRHLLESAHNLVPVGGRGTGKTQLATSLGTEARRMHGKQVRFFSTVELVNALELEKAQNKTGQLTHWLMYVD